MFPRVNILIKALSNGMLIIQRNLLKYPICEEYLFGKVVLTEDYNKK